VRLRLRVSGLLLLAGLACLASEGRLGSSSRAAPVPLCHWRAALVEDPHPRLFDRFDSVAVTRSGRAWAVGDYYTGHEGGPNGAFIEEWTGRRWQLVGRPLPNALLWSVSASGPADAWAVGDHLVEHWNGHLWRGVETARVRGGSIIDAVASHNPHDAWLVGERWTADRRIGRTLIEHWNGERWSVVPSPSPAAPGRRHDAILQAVDARSASDAWAAGYSISGKHGTAFRTLVEHWNGRRWEITPTPNVRASDGVLNDILFAVSGARRGGAWAVGSWASYAGGYGGKGDHALALRWDGLRWSQVSPAPIGGRTFLHGVAALGGTVWAVGDRGVPPRHETLIERWNGSRWTLSRSPSGFDLAAVSGQRDGPMWVVGAVSRRPLAARLVCP
jgi:hypothetical protein